MKFWDVVKEVSTQSVRAEAGRLFVLALVGDAELVERARLTALGPNAGSPSVQTVATPYLLCVSPPYNEATEKRLRHADLIVSLPGGPDLTEFRPADTVFLTQPEDLVRVALTRRPELRIPLARRLPGFRPAAAEAVIREVSRVNAEFAAVSGVSGALPFLAPLFPAVAGTDILVLTKNQVLMIFRLAAIYGEDLDLRARAREIAGVVGSAFGWRTLARELAGALPGGLGLPIRAGIAYSGTYGVGRAAQMVFDEGRRPTRKEMLRIYEDASTLARDATARVLERIGGGRSGKTAPKALPVPADPLAEVSTEAAAADPAATAETGS